MSDLDDLEAEALRFAHELGISFLVRHDFVHGRDGAELGEGGAADLRVVCDENFRVAAFGERVRHDCDVLAAGERFLIVADRFGSTAYNETALLLACAGLTERAHLVMADAMVPMPVADTESLAYAA